MSDTNTATQQDATTFLSREEAAAYLGVRTQTLAAWACSGRHGLRFVKVGRLAKYRRADVDAWIQRRTASSTAELSAALA